MSRAIATILFLAGAIIVNVFYLVPQWDRFTALRQEIAALETTSAELDDLIKKRDILFDTINSLPRDQLAQISQAIPRGPQWGELAMSLEALAAQHSVAFKNIVLAPPAARGSVRLGQPTPGGSQSTVSADDAVKELPFSLGLIGSYASLKSFLSALETSSRLIDITEVQFGSVEKGGLIDFSVRAKTYYQ